MSDNGDSDATKRAPFDPTTADPTELEWLKIMRPKIYDFTSRRTNPRNPSSAPPGASSNTGLGPAYPLDPSNTGLHVYTPTNYTTNTITPEEQRMINKIMHQAKTLYLATDDRWPPTMHVGIFIEPENPEGVSTIAALTPGDIGGRQPNEFPTDLSTAPFIKHSIQEILRSLQQVLPDAQEAQTAPLDIATTPVRDLGRVVYDPVDLGEAPRPVAGKASVPVRASADLLTAVLQGLYAEIRNQVDVCKEKRAFLYIAVFKGDTADGTVHMRAALAEPPTLSDSARSKFMRGETAVSAVGPADVDALRSGQKTEWLATGKPFFAILALLRTLEKDFFLAKQGGYTPIKLERREKAAVAVRGPPDPLGLSTGFEE